MARVLYSAFDVVPSPKGASTHIQHFVGGLSAAGHEVLLVTPQAPGLGDEDEFAGARLLRVGQAGSADSQAQPREAASPHAAGVWSRGNFLERALDFGEQVARLCESEGPFDVAHYRSVWSGLGVLISRERLGHVTVFEANSLPSVELPFHYPDLLGAPVLEKIRRLERTLLAESDALVCVSRVSRAFLASRGAPLRRIEVIPNGVDPEAFQPSPLPSLDGRVPLVLYVGTLADWQGLSVVVDALPRVLQHRPVHLRIVGRGRSRQRKDLLRRVRRLGLLEHVSFEPGRPHHEVPALIAEADVCVAPLAYNERNVVQGCCPLKVLEYLACGRPLVASNLPVVRELVREEKEALLVPPDAPEALAAALLRVLHDPHLARRLAERGARRVRAQFTWQRAQERLLRLYARLLAARDTARDRSAAPPRA